MRSLYGSFRVLLVTVFLGFLAPAQAQDASGTEWQDVITSQVQAFRDHDAAAAFSYAGHGFQESFPSAEQFFIAIIGSGYSPIMDSRSHSFGEFRLIDDVGVLQQVKFVGTNQELHQAIYQLVKEDAGWRVQGVQLVRQPGIGI